jgi:hypothetical protein
MKYLMIASISYSPQPAAHLEVPLNDQPQLINIDFVGFLRVNTVLKRRFATIIFHSEGR